MTLINFTGLLGLTDVTDQRASIVYFDSHQLVNNYKSMQDAGTGLYWIRD